MKKPFWVSLFLCLLLGALPCCVWAQEADTEAQTTHDSVDNYGNQAADHSGSIMMEMLRNPDRTLQEERIPIKVLILPHFELDEMNGDSPGEAQYYYEQYLAGGEEYQIATTCTDGKLYVKDGVALMLTGIGKITAALNTSALLNDPRFDFSHACILSTGCAGSAVGNSVMGDVFLITTAVDYDLGHHADIREMADQSRSTWFHDTDFDEAAVVRMNTELTDRVWDMVKDVKVETTENTRRCMSAAFDGADWAVRDPKVQKGTGVTGDNYWKGIYDQENAELMALTYACADPYAVTEMEDIGVARAVDSFGLLDHLLILRGSVNMDVFMSGDTPESLWGEGAEAAVSSSAGPEEELSEASQTESDEASSEETSGTFSFTSTENLSDIFDTAMKNNFEVGRVIIDAVLDGSLTF